MDQPLILVIDDSQTIRKLVECHLSQAGYRVAMAADAEQGLELARTLQPQLILLDHQLPGTTGDEVCRKLLEDESTARIPVVISSAMRNRAFAQYTEYPNVVDQIPKPFTPELLKSGVANALQTGAMVRAGAAHRLRHARGGRRGPRRPPGGDDRVVPAARGARFPEQSPADRPADPGSRQGPAALRAWPAAGSRRCTRRRFGPDRLEGRLPAELADLGPLLALTLGEQQDASMAGLVKMLERSLSDPRRLRALLRFQAAVLTYLATTGEPGKFAFERVTSLPPMFQAFPLQLSVPALVVEGSRCCDPVLDAHDWEQLVFARQTTRGGNPDRAGLAPAAIKIHALLGRCAHPGRGGPTAPVWTSARSWPSLGAWSWPGWSSAGRRPPPTPSSSWKTTRRPSA